MIVFAQCFPHLSYPSMYILPSGLDTLDSISSEASSGIVTLGEFTPTRRNDYLSGISSFEEMRIISPQREESGE